MKYLNIWQKHQEGRSFSEELIALWPHGQDVEISLTSPNNLTIRIGDANLHMAVPARIDAESW